LEAFEESVKVGAGELPLEGSGNALVMFLEPKESLLQLSHRNGKNRAATASKSAMMPLVMSAVDCPKTAVR
jgi:hypothetical protein